MKTTIDSLSKEIARAQEHVERARAAELAQAQADGLVDRALAAGATGEERRPCGCSFRPAG